MARRQEKKKVSKKDSNLNLDSDVSFTEDILKEAYERLIEKYDDKWITYEMVAGVYYHFVQFLHFVCNTKPIVAIPIPKIGVFHVKVSQIKALRGVLSRRKNKHGYLNKADTQERERLNTMAKKLEIAFEKVYSPIRDNPKIIKTFVHMVKPRTSSPFFTKGRSYRDIEQIQNDFSDNFNKEIKQDKYGKYLS